MNIICLPFAGGSSYSYFDLKKNIPNGINLVFPELPGRGKRVADPLCSNMHDLMNDIYKQILSTINSGSPYAIYGHSMGSLLGYLLTQKIESQTLPSPVHFFVSGRGGMAAVYEDEPLRHTMNREDFIQKLKEYGGSSAEITEDADMMDFFEPILRSDFKAVETYAHNFDTEKIKVPITVMYGSTEKVTLENANEWKNDTTGKVTIHEFIGNHFFILDHWPAISKLIAGELSPYMNSKQRSFND